MTFLLLGLLTILGLDASLPPACRETSTVWREADGFSVDVTRWEAAAPPPAGISPGTVIVLPPTGGATPLEARYAEGLCQRGQRVLLLKNWTGLDDDAIDFQVHNRLFGRANRAVDLALNHVAGEPRLLGTSLGALYGLSALARHPEIRRAVLIVSGYPLTAVIARSDHPSMQLIREARHKQFGIKTVEEYQAKLDGVFRWNDLGKPGVLKDTKLLLFQATNDVAVPTSTQVELSRALPQAAKVEVDGGHFWVIVKTYLEHEKEILQHLTSADPAF